MSFPGGQSATVRDGALVCARGDHLEFAGETVLMRGESPDLVTMRLGTPTVVHGEHIGSPRPDGYGPRSGYQFRTFGEGPQNTCGMLWAESSDSFSSMSLQYAPYRLEVTVTRRSDEIASSFTLREQQCEWDPP